MFHQRTCYHRLTSQRVTKDILTHLLCLHYTYTYRHHYSLFCMFHQRSFHFVLGTFHQSAYITFTVIIVLYGFTRGFFINLHYTVTVTIVLYLSPEDFSSIYIITVITVLCVTRGRFIISLQFTVIVLYVSPEDFSSIYITVIIVLCVSPEDFSSSTYITLSHHCSVCFTRGLFINLH